MADWETDRERWPIEEAWPAHVSSIGMDRLDYLGIDRDGNLYWDGKRVEVRRPLSLTFWQRAGAVVISVSALVAAAAAAISAYADIVKL